MAKISVLSVVHILDEAKPRIQELSSDPVDFPSAGSGDLEELVTRTGAAEIVLIGTGTKISKEYLDRCPSVRYIGVCGTSMTNVDTALLDERGIAYANVKDYADEPTAEFIFMQLTRLARGIGDYQWKPDPHTLMGKTITIVGLGMLGQAIADLALAYKMHVQYFSRTRKDEWEAKGVAFGPLNELLTTSDIVVLTVPTDTLTMAAEQFAALKPGAIVVQASMGKVLDEQAFRQWIATDSNFAIFDYSAGENIYHSYHDLDRVVFPTIVAGFALETRQRLGDIFIGNIKNYLASIGS